MAPLKERDQSSYVWRVCHWDKNSYQLFSLFQKYIWRREGATHLRRCNGQCGGSPSDSRAVAGDIAVISDRIREMSVDEWWPKKKVKGNKRRRHVVTFWELLIVWKMRLRFSFFFLALPDALVYIFYFDFFPLLFRAARFAIETPLGHFWMDVTFWPSALIWAAFLPFSNSL